ncbi:TIGR02452 family protein [Micromonospora parva]|uniref:TIGR02452 family protein n=1 Tax=Micromonospora parva TaxID=1464048 RepID=UPI00378B88C2
MFDGNNLGSTTGQREVPWLSQADGPLVAAAHGHRTIVLGAWGCGVFRNDPATVAGAFADALQMIDRFDHVVFAIHDGLPGAPVYRTFAARFRGSAGESAGDHV